MFDPLLISIFLGTIWWLVISHLGASILLHRYYCHNQFNVPIWFEFLGLFMLAVAYVRSPIGWIASHRMHHAYSDTSKDPHSAKYVGFWKVFFTLWDIPRIPSKFAKDLYKNPRLLFMHNHHKKVIVAIWVISFLISPYFFIAFAFVPFVFAKIGFGLLNTLGHKEVGGTDVPWINFFTAGEGYHKQHHTDNSLVRLHKWDTGGWVAEKLFIGPR
jgi:fatty-acid desaturase